MDLVLRRQSFNQWGVVSVLSDSQGEQIAVCLEHAFPNGKGGFAPKLPYGVYECILGTHRLDHGGAIQAYEITGVPGHSGILFHIGNVNADSDGCVLVGSALGDKRVTGSKNAFDQLMKLQGGVNFTLSVTT